MNAGAALMPPTGPAALAPGEVQVLHFMLDVDAAGETALARLLDDEERRQAQRFHFAQHRRRFTVRRGMLRLVLARHTGMAPENLRFLHGAAGKPALARPDGDTLRFSASSSGGLGAVALTRGRELGLDLEQVRPIDDRDLIAASEFSAEENDWLQRLPEAERLAAFYRLWTCKEAYLKGKGTGLTVPLDDFAISPGRATPRLVWSNLDGADPERWTLQPLTLAPGFAACLAVEGSCPAVRVEPWSPGSGDGDAATIAKEAAC
jgi:4'-phosphopantetheinyl transferase